MRENSHRPHTPARLLTATLLIGCASSGGLRAEPEATVAERPARVTTTPAHRLGDNWWKARHNAKLGAPERADAELVFLGDSITHAFEEPVGIAVWREHYAPRKAFNLGFSGDRTEHVLWRLDHGEMDGIKPKVIVIMIGTNNTGHNMSPPADIAAGVEAICERLRAMVPESHILLLGIFPRGATPADPTRINNVEANKLIAALADGEHIRFADISPAFLTPDGTLSRTVMPDLLHPNTNGYRIWARELDKILDEMLAPAGALPQ